MTLKKYSLIIFLLFTSKIYSQKKTYDFSCIGNDQSAVMINVGSDLEKGMLELFGNQVSINDEIMLGNSTLKEIKKKYIVETSGVKYENLNKILLRLTKKIENNAGFNYSIYLLKSEELNAFTCGGKIFFTSKMYDFCKNDNEISAIIGHEISHNELGHIKETIKRLKTAESFGDMGLLSAMVGQVMTTPFNQKNETHCDFKGIDLAVAAGYDACAVTELWKRMSEQQKDNDVISTFFSTHPYSGKRAICCRNHLKINYSMNCKQ